MSARSGTVLVTGAGGFIGSHLVEALVRQGVQVRAFVHYNSRNDWGHLESLPEETREAIEVVASDICDAYAVRAVAEGCDTIYHLAALIGIPYSYAAQPRPARRRADTRLRGHGASGRQARTQAGPEIVLGLDIVAHPVQAADQLAGCGELVATVRATRRPI